MLDYFRKQSNSLVSTFLILVTAATMALIYGTTKFNSGSKDPEGVAAWVNGEPISRREFAREYESLLYRYQSMLGDQVDERFLQALQVPEHALDSLVRNKLLTQQAKHVGVVVPDKELADYIRSLPYFQKDGKFSAELYSKVSDPGREERLQREALVLQKYQNYLVDRVRFTPLELKDIYQLKDAKADIDYAEIHFDKLGSDHKVSSAETEAFLKNTKEADLKAYYDEHVRDFTEPAQVDLYQIRVGLPFQANEAKRKEAREKIDKIQKKLTAENFSQIAGTDSDDEYAKKGGHAGWIKRGSLEPALEKALDTIPVGQQSGPLETPFGFYILKYTAKKDSVTKTMDMVKKQVAEKLALQTYQKKIGDETRAEFEKKLAEGKPLDSDLKKWKIEVKKTGPFSLGRGFIPNIGQLDSVVDAVFELNPKNPVSKKLVQVADKYYYIKLRSVELPKASEFEKNAPVTEKESITGLQGELLNQWVNALQKQSNIKTELQFKKPAAPESSEG